MVLIMVKLLDTIGEAAKVERSSKAEQDEIAESVMILIERMFIIVIQLFKAAEVNYLTPPMMSKQG
jgi:hypothetical protein